MTRAVPSYRRAVPRSIPIGPATESRSRASRSSVRIALVAPDQKSKHIRRLKGTIPVFAETRASNPIVIPLQGKSAVGKQMSTSSVTLLVDDVSTTNENRPAVRVTVRPTRDGRGPAGTGPGCAPCASLNRGDALQHLALYDATGKLVNSTVGEQTTGGDSQGLFSRYRLVRLSRRRGG